MWSIFILNGTAYKINNTRERSVNSVFVSAPFYRIRARSLFFPSVLFFFLIYNLRFRYYRLVFCKYVVTPYNLNLFFNLRVFLSNYFSEASRCWLFFFRLHFSARSLFIIFIYLAGSFHFNKVVATFKTLPYLRVIHVFLICENFTPTIGIPRRNACVCTQISAFTVNIRIRILNSQLMELQFHRFFSFIDLKK